MRLLLVGFSEQSVNTLKIFCQRNFNAFVCESVDRQFTDSLRLTLPTLTDQQTSCDAYMIFLGGVGMTMFMPAHVRPLLNFMSNKPTILVTRKQSQIWQKKLSLCAPNTLYLDIPYDSQTISDNLDNLLKVIANSSNDKQASNKYRQPSLSEFGEAQGVDSSVSGNSHISSVNQVSSSANDTDSNSIKNATNNSDVDATTDGSDPSQPLDTTSINRTPIESKTDDFGESYASVTNNLKTKRIDKVLKTFFPDVYEQSFVRSSLLVWAQTVPLKITAGAHGFYVNAVERRAIVREDLTKLIQFVGIAGRYLFNDTMSIGINKVPLLTYKKTTDKLLQNGYMNYSLHTLIWQLAEATLPQEFRYIEHNLKVKVITLPNFKVMPDVPDYVYPVLAACLAKPRSIADLQNLFPDLAPMTLNRLLVMAMLSGILDDSLLVVDDPDHVTVGGGTGGISDDGLDYSPNDDDITDNSTSDSIGDSNSAIKKARKTGIFRRLLEKLSF